MERVLVGYGLCVGNKMLLHSTEAKRKTKELCKVFIDKICDLKGVADKESYYNEGSYKTIRYGLTKVEVFDCEIYYSVRFENGQANYPKTDCSELVFF